MKYTTGIRFNRLHAVKFIEKRNGHNYWLFKCSCGNDVIRSLSSVKSGNTKSCGCLNTEILNKNLYRKNQNHGLSRTRFYRILVGIKARCDHEKHQSYKRYGGRGIKYVWKNFIEFRDDMYESYLKHVGEFGEKQTTIDRIDNDGNYCKDNCRWATYQEQANNKSTKGKIYIIENEQLTAKEIMEYAGISKSAFYSRLKAGWSLYNILITPMRKKGKNRIKDIKCSTNSSTSSY